MTTLAAIANRLGYDYTPINGFPMPWYDTYGLHTKDYFFDRFTPRGTPQKALLILIRAVWWLVYIFPFGLWLTFAGRFLAWLYDTILEVTGRKPEVPENPYLKDHES